MTFSYDLSTDIGVCRVLFPDIDAGSALFSDEQWQAFLTLEGGVKRAVALALETVASDTALLLNLKSGDDSVNGSTSANTLIDRAAKLRTQADATDDQAGGGWAIAEWNVDPFSARDILGNAIVRGAV